MAEVRLEPRRRRVWPWLLALLVLAVAIWSAGEVLTSEVPAPAAARATAAAARSGHGAAVRPAHPAASPRRPASPTRDPRREEALRIRTRMMA
jgi:hypothetical protein